MTPQFAAAQFNLERVFPDACRDKKAKLDALHGIAVQTHEILAQRIRTDRGNTDSDPVLKSLEIISEVIGSISDSVSRFQANRALFYKDSSCLLSAEDAVRIMDFKKLDSWLDSISEDAPISELAKGLQTALKTINGTLNTVKEPTLSDKLLGEFGAVFNQLFLIQSHLFEFSKSLLPARN